MSIRQRCAYCTFLLLLAGSIGRASDWWDTDWDSRQRLNLRSIHRSDLSNAMVRVILDTQSLIAAGDLQSDGDDLRFVVPGTPSSLSVDYCIRSGWDTASTEVLVKIPSLPGQDELGQLEAYYDNPNALAAQNCTALAEVSDDFDDESSGANPSAWTVVEGGTASVAVDDTVYAGSSGKSVHLEDLDTSEVASISQSLSRLTQFYFSGRFRFGETTINHEALKASASAGAIHFVVARNNGNWGYYDGTAYQDFADQSGYSASTWYHVEVQADFGAGRYSVWIDGERVAAAVKILTDGTSISSIICQAGSSSETGEMWADDLFLSSDGLPRISSRASVSGWHHPDHDYRQPLYLDNPHGHGLENVLASFTFDPHDLVTAGKLQSDLADLRFTYYDPFTQLEVPLGHYLESSGSAETVTLQINSLLAGTGSLNGSTSFGTNQFQEGMAWSNGMIYLAYLGNNGTLAGVEDSAVS
ncbi:MAG: DUF2341 domain-containing protein, partial [Acidobacteriota bacterium]